LKGISSRHLAGKTVVITGASLGIGREIAFKFAKEGCSLALTYYKDKSQAMDVGRKCRELGAKQVLVLHLNVGDEKSIRTVVKQVVTKFKRVSILVNNAGIVIRKPFRSQTLEEIENQIGTNLIGLMKLTKESIPYVDEVIINVASSAGKQAISNLTTYCASKFGVRGFTQALALEYPNLKVYAVNPDRTSTRMTSFMGRPAEEVARVILNTVKGKYAVENGGDIDVWKVLGQ